jgi:isopenicillin-N N-acyltransferase like protein
MVAATSQIRVIECKGTDLEIGRAHGEAARELIALGLERWRDGIAVRRGDPHAYVARFLAQTSFQDAVARITPNLLDELRGIAEGSAQEFDLILAYNLMDEEWSFRTGRLDGMAPGCTVVAVAGKAIAQTMDIPTIHDGTQVVLAIQPEKGPAQRVFTAAGMLGLNGANDAGVGVVVNNLSQLPSSTAGVPVAFVTRGILKHESADAAGRWTESVPHAVGQHYLIGDPTELISIEGAANGTFRIPVSDRYVHTNHALANRETRPETAEIERASNTRARFDRATHLAADASDQDDLQRILEDREAPISCARTAGFMTFGGISIGLSVPPTVRVTAGPPHEAPWTEISWK